MAKFRMIHCLIWHDDKFPFLSDDAQLVWLHAFTYPHSTGLGIYMASIEALAANKRWPVKRYRKGLGECLENLSIRFDERFQVVWFPNYFRWNKPANPNIFKGLLKKWDSIPNCEFKNELYYVIQELAKEWGKGYVKVAETLPKPSANVRGTYSKTETDTETDTDTDTERDIKHSCVIQKERITRDGVGGFVKMFNEKFKDTPVPLVSSISKSRAKKIRTRIRENNMEYWEKVFDKALESSFLMGNNRNDWVLTFDWLIANQDNSVKVIEGVYANRTLSSNAVNDFMREGESDGG